MLEVLERWNRWGAARLDAGVRRDVLDDVLPFLSTKDVVAFAGPRRAGKSTLMFQVMDALEAKGVRRTAMLHANLEEPALQPRLGVELLDEMLQAFREHVHPSGRAYVFLDEVQRVEGWERWARARTETDDLKVFVTGSTSRLLSRELGTLLTGRHVEFRVWPLGFGEMLRFRGIAVPPARLVTAPAPVAGALLDYLRWGGFPEIVLADDDARKERLLLQYFDDILFKDVGLRHEVRDLVTLRSIAVHLLTSTASMISSQRLAGLFGISVDQARAYAAHLEEAFVVSFAPAFSLKVAERRRNPQKVHAVDTGLRHVVVMTGSADLGRVAETAVFAALRRETAEPLHYGKDGGEVDVLRRRGSRTTDLVQVCWDASNALLRETSALQAGLLAHRGARATLVVHRPLLPAQIPPGIDVVPLWRFLLRPAKRTG